MTCVYEYQGKTYDRDDFTKLLLNMTPAEASKYMPGVDFVVDAPFVNSTSKYVGLSLRRMVRYAAENGFDSIAWTPGDVQVDRYKEALRRAVDKVEWTKEPGGIVLQGFKNGHEVVNTLEKESSISDAIGKSMGDKIIASPEQSGTFEGDDITISDTGMAGFYDKILPSVANKFFNKQAWGKARVRVANILSGQVKKTIKAELPNGDNIFISEDSSKKEYWVYDEKTGMVLSDEPFGSFEDAANTFSAKIISKPITFEAWQLPITPEMKSKAIDEGMPLFTTKGSKGPITLKDVQSAFKGSTVTEKDGNFNIKAPGGAEFTIETVESISEDEVQFGLGYGRDKVIGEKISGRAIGTDITLIKKAGKWILAHEKIHTLENINLIRPSERTILRRHIKALALIKMFKTANKNDIGGAEDRANYIADQLQSRSERGRIGQIIQKIADFIDSLVSLIPMVRTARGIVKDVESGKVLERKPFVPGSIESYMVSYHGTPHVWPPEPGFPHGRPRLDKIGTGEGAAAYGFGWYSAQSEGVGQSYQTRLAGKHATLDGKPIDYSKFRGDSPDIRALGFVLDYDSIDEAISEASELPYMREDVKKVIESWRGRFEMDNGGATYTLDIPDSVMPKLLDWDKPLSEQTEYVKKALESAFSDQADEIKRKNGEWRNITGEQLYDGLIGVAAQGTYSPGALKVIVEKTGYTEDQLVEAGQKEISEFFRAIGIPGNKYLDGMSRGNAASVVEKIGNKWIVKYGGGNWAHYSTETAAREAAAEHDKNLSYNYVLWDQAVLDRIALLKRNGEKLDAMREQYSTTTEKDLAEEISSDFLGNWKKVPPTLSMLRRAIGTPLYNYTKKIPALRAIFERGMKWADSKEEYFNAFVNNEAGETMTVGMSLLKKERPEEYKNIWKPHIVQADVNARGYSVTLDKSSGQFILKDPDGVELDRFVNEDEAWDTGFNVYERADYRKKGGSEQGADRLVDFRRITRRLYKHYTKSIDDAIAMYEQMGEEPPKAVYVDDKNNKVKVDLHTAKILMGNRQGYYMPRIRPEGRLVLIAKKKTGERVREHFDVGTMNPVDKDGKPVRKWIRGVKGAVNYATPLMRAYRKYTKEGYEVTIEGADKLPDSTYIDLAGQHLAMNAIISKGLERALQATSFTMKDMGVSTKWFKGKEIKQYKVNGTWLDEKMVSAKEKAEKDFIEEERTLPGNTFMVYGDLKKELYKDVFEELGGEYSFKTMPRGGATLSAPAWTFKNAPEDIEEQITDLVFEMSGINRDIGLAFASSLVTEIANIEKSRGALSRTIGRSDATGKNVWKGYEEDPEIALTKAARGASGGEAKRVFGQDAIRLLTGRTESWKEYQTRMKEEGKPWKGSEAWKNYKALVDSRKIDPGTQTGAYKDAQSYIYHILRNDDVVDRIVGITSGLSVLKFLGFRVAAPVVNLTALPTTVVGTYMSHNIPAHKAFKYLGKAMRQYNRHYRNISSGQWKEVFDEIHRRGWHKAQYNMEALAVLKTKAGRKWDYFMDKSMWMFGATEQLNRVATISGAVEGILERDGKSWSDLNEEAKESMLMEAYEISNKAHGVYNKANHMAAVRGEGAMSKVLRAPLLFKTFSINYLNNLALMIGEGQVKPALYMMISPAILAGAGASVLTPVVATLLSALGMDDPEEEFYDWAENELGMDKLARLGLAGMAGINIKGSLQAVGIGDIPTDLKSFFGAPGAMVSQAYYGGQAMMKGDYAKGFEQWTPINAFGSMSKAIRESSGVTTRTNAPVFYGKEQLKPSVMDSVLRFFSFNPAEISIKREKQWKEKLKSYRYSDQRADIYSKLRKFYSLPLEKRTKGRLADIVVDIEIYNERASKAKFSVPIITPKSIKSNLKRSFRASKRERERKL